MNRKERLVPWIAALPALLALALFGAAGCGDDDPSKPPDQFAPPTNLTYVNGNGEVSLDWDGTPDETWDNFAGYKVYRHTSSLVGVAGSELEQYRIATTQAGTTSYIDRSAANGTMYYYSVRGAKDNGDLTQPTNEIDTAARPEGLVTLAEFASTAASGLDLSAGQALAMSSQNPDNTGLIDLYLGTAGTNDETDQPLALKSPHLVLGGTSGVWVRQAGLKLLEDPTAPTTPNTGWLEEITLGNNAEEIQGKVIAVRTPVDGTEFHYGKLVAISASGAQGERQVQFVWAHQELPNYIRF